MRVMDRFMHEKFMGVFLEVSDDRTLTNLTLKEGYRTVYQYTSLVYTDAPLQVKKLFKQQLRWARGSQYNTLRMLPWMLGHAPILAAFFITDIILPFMLFGVIAGWIYRAFTGQGENLYQGILSQYGFSTGFVYVAALMVISSVLSMAIRQMRHLSEKPSDFFRLPMFIIVSTFFLMPIRLIGFFRLAHASGWDLSRRLRRRSDAGGPGGRRPAAVLHGPDPGQPDRRRTCPDDRCGRRIGGCGGLGFGLVRSARHRRPGGRRPRVRRALRRRRGDQLHHHRPRHPPRGRSRGRAAGGPASSRAAPARARRYNPYAAIPYVIGIAIFALEAFLIV